MWPSPAQSVTLGSVVRLAVFMGGSAAEAALLCDSTYTMKDVLLMIAQASSTCHLLVPQGLGTTKDPATIAGTEQLLLSALIRQHGRELCHPTPHLLRVLFFTNHQKQAQLLLTLLRSLTSPAQPVTA